MKPATYINLDTKASENRSRFSPKRFPGAVSFITLQAILLGLSGLISLMFIVEVARFLPVRADNLYPESAGILSAYRWAQGLPLYADYRQPPYLITPFPPLWYGLIRAGMALGFNTLDKLTLFGRLLTISGLVGLLGLGYSWNRQMRFSRPLSALTISFYLSLPILIPWAVAARPDFVAIFLGFLAVYWVGLRRTMTAAAIAGVVGGMAFLARHNAVSVPIAVVLWCVCMRRWKHAVTFSAFWWLVVILTLLAFQSSSHGMLALNLSGASFGQFSLSYVRDILGRLLQAPGSGFVIALFGYGLFGFLASWNQSDERIRLISIYASVTLLLAVFGSAARGSAVNHYFEPAFAMAMLIPVGLAQLQPAWRTDLPLAALLVVLNLVLLLPSLDGRRSSFSHDKPEDLRGLASIVEKSYVFTDIPYLAARSPAHELLEPASLLNSERADARVAWSSRNIAENLNSKKYELVILSSPPDPADNTNRIYPRYPHLDPLIQAAVIRNYGLCSQIETSSIYGQIESRYVYGRLAADGNAAYNCPK